MRARFDAVLVLGLQLAGDDSPKPEMVARADTAAEVYRRFERESADAPPVVVCGGVLPGHKKAEADVLEELLVSRGVPQSAIVKEDRSQTTMENMRFAANVLGGARGKRVLVVTSDYHVRRAVLTARRAGFRASGEGAPLVHDEAWKLLKGKEWGFTLDLLLGWQDEGKRRPDAAQRLFDWVFGKR